MTLENNSLLPNGLKDLLPREAEKEAYLINLIMQEFSKFGYSRVKPPLVEFEESLLNKGPGAALARNTFRLMDPVSQRMMGVRADTTAQIARIAKSRMADAIRPLRLSYAADVLKVNGSQLRPERQFCQVGCEMIADKNAGDTTQDDVEICLNALNALNKAQIKNLSIDLTIPAVVDDLFDAFDVDEAQRIEFSEHLKKRDRDGLMQIQSPATECFVAMLDASGVAHDAIEMLNKIDIPKTAQNNISKIKDVYVELEKAMKAYGLNDIKITIDLIERRGFEYQNGLSFTLFSTFARGELGRGGRYKIYSDTTETASGFTLYMDSVLRASEVEVAENKKTIPDTTSWEDIKKIQDEGYQVSRHKK